jgi:hypothetical protein
MRIIHTSAGKKTELNFCNKETDQYHMVFSSAVENITNFIAMTWKVVVSNKLPQSQDQRAIYHRNHSRLKVSFKI